MDVSDKCSWTFDINIKSELIFSARVQRRMVIVGAVRISMDVNKPLKLGVNLPKEVVSE